MAAEIESDPELYDVDAKNAPCPSQNILKALAGREYGSSKKQLLSGELLAAAEDHLVTKRHDELTCEIPAVSRSTYLMAFSSDGSKVASTHGNHNVYVTDLKTGKNISTLVGHPRTPWCIEFHPTAKEIIATGCLGGEVRVWDINGGSEVWSTENSNVITSLAFHPTQRLLVIATLNMLYFWDWSHQKPFMQVSTASIRERIRYVAFDSIGHKLITGIANSAPIRRGVRPGRSSNSSSPDVIRFRSGIYRNDVDSNEDVWNNNTLPNNAGDNQDRDESLNSASAPPLPLSPESTFPERGRLLRTLFEESRAPMVRQYSMDLGDSNDRPRDNSNYDSIVAFFPDRNEQNESNNFATNTRSDPNSQNHTVQNQTDRPNGVIDLTTSDSSQSTNRTAPNRPHWILTRSAAINMGMSGGTVTPRTTTTDSNATTTPETSRNPSSVLTWFLNGSPSAPMDPPRFLNRMMYPAIVRVRTEPGSNELSADETLNIAQTAIRDALTPRENDATTSDENDELSLHRIYERLRSGLPSNESQLASERESASETNDAVVTNDGVAYEQLIIPIRLNRNENQLENGDNPASDSEINLSNFIIPMHFNRDENQLENNDNSARGSENNTSNRESTSTQTQPPQNLAQQLTGVLSNFSQTPPSPIDHTTALRNNSLSEINRLIRHQNRFSRSRQMELDAMAPVDLSFNYSTLDSEIVDASVENARESNLVSNVDTNPLSSQNRATRNGSSSTGGSSGLTRDSSSPTGGSSGLTRDISSSAGPSSSSAGPSSSSVGTSSSSTGASSSSTGASSSSTWASSWLTCTCNSPNGANSGFFTRHGSSSTGTGTASTGESSASTHNTGAPTSDSNNPGPSPTTSTSDTNDNDPNNSASMAVIQINARLEDIRLLLCMRNTLKGFVRLHAQQNARDSTSPDTTAEPSATTAPTETLRTPNEPSDPTSTVNNDHNYHRLSDRNNANLRALLDAFSRERASRVATSAVFVAPTPSYSEVQAVRRSELNNLENASNRALNVSYMNFNRETYRRRQRLFDVNLRDDRVAVWNRLMNNRRLAAVTATTSSVNNPISSAVVQTAMSQTDDVNNSVNSGQTTTEGGSGNVTEPPSTEQTSTKSTGEHLTDPPVTTDVTTTAADVPNPCDLNQPSTSSGQSYTPKRTPSKRFSHKRKSMQQNDARALKTPRRNVELTSATSTNAAEIPAPPTNLMRSDSLEQLVNTDRTTQTTNDTPMETLEPAREPTNQWHDANVNQTSVASQPDTPISSPTTTNSTSEQNPIDVGHADPTSNPRNIRPLPPMRTLFRMRYNNERDNARNPRTPGPMRRDFLGRTPTRNNSSIRSGRSHHDFCRPLRRLYRDLFRNASDRIPNVAPTNAHCAFCSSGSLRAPIPLRIVLAPPNERFFHERSLSLNMLMESVFVDSTVWTDETNMYFLQLIEALLYELNSYESVTSLADRHDGGATRRNRAFGAGRSLVEVRARLHGENWRGPMAARTSNARNVPERPVIGDVYSSLAGLDPLLRDWIVRPRISQVRAIIQSRLQQSRQSLADLGVTVDPPVPTSNLSDNDWNSLENERHPNEFSASATLYRYEMVVVSLIRILTLNYRNARANRSFELNERGLMLIQLALLIVDSLFAHRLDEINPLVMRVSPSHLVPRQARYFRTQIMNVCEHVRGNFADSLRGLSGSCRHYRTNEAINNIEDLSRMTVNDNGDVPSSARASTLRHYCDFRYNNPPWHNGSSVNFENFFFDLHINLQMLAYETDIYILLLYINRNLAARSSFHTSTDFATWLTRFDLAISQLCVMIRWSFTVGDQHIVRNICFQTINALIAANSAIDAPISVIYGPVRTFHPLIVRFYARYHDVLNSWLVRLFTLFQRNPSFLWNRPVANSQTQTDESTETQGNRRATTAPSIHINDRPVRDITLITDTARRILTRTRLPNRSLLNFHRLGRYRRLLYDTPIQFVNISSASTNATTSTSASTYSSPSTSTSTAPRFRSSENNFRYVPSSGPPTRASFLEELTVNVTPRPLHLITQRADYHPNQIFSLEPHIRFYPRRVAQADAPPANQERIPSGANNMNSQFGRPPPLLYPRNRRMTGHTFYYPNFDPIEMDLDFSNFSHPNHRIQVWDVSDSTIPSINNAEKNIVVQECKIANDASVDISKDGTKLVALLPSNPNLTICNKIGVFSLNWENLGQCLFSTTFQQNAVSVSLSATSRYLAVGMASRRISLLVSNENSVIAQVYKLEPDGRMVLKRDIEKTPRLTFTSVNCIRWSPIPGQGLVYATNTGKLRVLT